jgi:hypothetical protein
MRKGVESHKETYFNIYHTTTPESNTSESRGLIDVIGNCAEQHPVCFTDVKGVRKSKGEPILR